MSSQVKSEISAFTHSLLDDRLAQLSDAQRELFSRVYPRLTDDNIVSAIDLCDRTIKKNLDRARAPALLRRMEE